MATNPPHRIRHTLAWWAALLFFVSTSFPVGASLISVGAWPRWMGVADVITAFTWVFVVFAIETLTREKPSDEIRKKSFAVYRAISILPLALIVIYFLAGDRVDWEVLLIGLGWRSWLAIYAFPNWLEAWLWRMPK
jgi:hypothetical protein